MQPAQIRADPASYERYLRGMDASMRQKVALTAAHLLCRGRVADMGMGSGAGSEALAALYPDLEVIGVDIDAGMVERAQSRWKLPNLRFVQGDIATDVFGPGNLDSIFDSSVLHHVTSFGGYEAASAGVALAAQTAQLREGGVLIVRDFLAPGQGRVLLELPANDGDGSDDPRVCSTAQLFERFAREFRSLHAAPGFSFERVAAADVQDGWRRYRVSLKHATEFILRKDYRADWEAEAQEEYTYFTQSEFEARFAALGLRVLASTPIHNPWIVRHRYTGKLALRSEDGTARDLPATNYVIVGEKVPDGEGVRFRQAASAEPLGFLRLERYRHRATGQRMDLVRRPNLTLDIVPWFALGEQRFVLARMSYPRPILRTDARAAAAIDGCSPADYVTEPLNVLQTDKPLGQTVEEALEACARISSEQLRSLAPGASYYPSPGGIQEEVRAAFVEIEPLFVQEAIPNVSGFSTSGRVRAIEAQQLLRSAQVGGLPDARLEMNVYELLLGQGRSVGPWIGEELEIREAKSGLSTTTLDTLLSSPPRRAFLRAGSEESAGFLELRSALFEELSASGEVLCRQALEYVVPKTRSAGTVATAPLACIGGVIHIGLDDDDLPAAQAFNGQSNLLVAPAWRLTAEVRSRASARARIIERLANEYGVSVGEIFELGGAYHPSAGATPEVVFPWAVEVVEATGSLRWVPLAEVARGRAALRDGHLRIVALRAAHALGLL